MSKTDLINNERLTIGQANRIETTRKDYAIFVGDTLRLRDDIDKLFKEDLRDDYLDEVRIYSLKE